MPKKTIEQAVEKDKTAIQDAPVQEEMAVEPAGVEPVKAPEPAYEDVHIPPARPGEEEQLVLYFNGRSYIMDKGGTYRLPKAVAAEYHRSVRAAQRAHARKKEMQKKEKAINAHTDAVIAGKV